ncbi:aldehyde dehydrogenase family protein [Pseudomonas sp. MOB-449]|nr:aldehyde dehydrogenase family protein [Pseudomonas sp. MOB-449]
MLQENSVRVLNHHINGTDTEGSSGRYIERKNPANGALVARWPEGTADDVDRAVQAARAAFDDGRWSGLTGGQRSNVLRKTAELLKARYQELALIETQETGKPLSQSLEEIPWAADLWDFAAGQARAIHGDTHGNLGGDRLAVVLREPVGVVGLITPWNYPLLVLTQKLCYALAAGCTIVAKPSELTAGTTLALAKILEEAGLPAGVFNVVTGYGDPVGVRISEHPQIDMVSFTGSTAVGKAITRAAAGNLKKVVLELGGKNPNVVFADADLDAAVDGAVKAILYNMGEECCAGSRLIVQSSIADDFVARVIEKMKTYTMGDPMDGNTKVGPLIDEKHFNKVVGCIEDGKKNADLAYGGTYNSEVGYYVSPTVFTNVKVGTKLAQEEIFGPVLSVLTFDDLAEAIEIANAVDYGLAAAIWTTKLDTATTAARRIKAGIVWVNTFMDVPTEAPFGGVKQSGVGRENGRYATEEYTVLKTVMIQTLANI